MKKFSDAPTGLDPLPNRKRDVYMATRFNKVLAHLHRVLTPPDDGLSDGQLLARFVAARDQTSFAALVRRHGPMVWRVCLRVLGHVQDAEDTFQATFLVLACKAASVQKQESVGSFLYGVAYRTALDARTVRLRRRLRERQVEDMPHPEVAPPPGQDWRPWLDQELSRLPEKYRAAIILCDLEGRTRKDAARHLKIPEGTLSSRLATARRLLAKRLTRYGLSLSGGALAVALSESSSVAAPGPLVAATVQAAVLAASGQWAVSASVAFLTKGAMKTMLVSKLKWVIGSVMLVTFLGAGGLVYQASGQSAAGDKRGLSEVEALRRENELLKLNLEIVLEKVRAQENEMHAMRKQINQPMDWNTNTIKFPAAFDPAFPIQEKTIVWSPDAKKPVNPAQEVETALKKLGVARDPDSYRVASEELNKAMQKLREHLANQGGSIQDLRLSVPASGPAKPKDAPKNK
jgi:RNA polymerase sigma factor (sigma-70 family)